MFLSLHLAPAGRLERLKRALLRLITLSYAKLRNINIFPPRTFREGMPRETADRLGRWSTRLYIVLVIVSLATLILQTSIKPQVLTKTFTNPSMDVYNRLLLDRGDSLQCPCSSISSPLHRHVTVEPIFHQVREYK
jgi:hypothetical protein